jgi:succinate dehydrogenase hydrophobic anchor subunit
MTDQQDRASPSPYEVPTPYGSAAGIESASSVAAPLLAGGALALAGVVVQQEDSLRYPGVVLVLLVAALVMLVLAVQCGFWARQYAVTPDEIRQWWPDANPARSKVIEAEQHRHAASHAMWSNRVAIAFNVGVLFLWLALGLAVTPKDYVQEPTWRWVAAGLAGLAALVNAVWLILGVLGQRPGPLSRWLHDE